MKISLLKAIVLLALGIAMNSYAQTDTLSRAETTVPELSGLNIEECVMVLNLKTEYQVNLETHDYDYSRPKYRLDLIGLQKQPIEQVLTTLLDQTGDYVFLKTNRVINLIPKDQKSNAKYVFNTILRKYDVNQQNLVGAWEIFSHKVHRHWPFSASVCRHRCSTKVDR